MTNSKSGVQISFYIIQVNYIKVLSLYHSSQLHHQHLDYIIQVNYIKVLSLYHSSQLHH